MFRLAQTITTILWCTCRVFAKIIHVPADTTSIQGGIDLATDGYTVLVDVGTYVENLNFNGKSIIVAIKSYNKNMSLEH